MNLNYDPLFQSFDLIDGLALSNRIVMSPMTTWSGTADFHITTEEENYYRARADGVGLVVTGCAQVTPNGIGFSNEFSAADDGFLPSLKRLATAAKSGGAPAFLQIFHAGNKALPHLIPDGDVVSASAVPTASSAFAPSLTPRALETAEVSEVIDAFGAATKRAIEAGFDGVELHAAHGFLMQNFLSPATNHRSDQWGGHLDNRMRFSLAVVEGAKKAIRENAKGPFALGVRISPEEPGDLGYRIDQTLEFVDHLIGSGVNYIHVSLTDLLGDRPIGQSEGPTIAECIVDRVAGRVPVFAAGGIVTPAQAIAALDIGLACVAIGRGLIMNPEWVQLVREGKEVDAALDDTNLEHLKLPPKLWSVIQSMKGWVRLKSDAA